MVGGGGGGYLHIEVGCGIKLMRQMDITNSKSES